MENIHLVNKHTRLVLGSISNILGVNNSIVKTEGIESKILFKSIIAKEKGKPPYLLDIYLMVKIKFTGSRFKYTLINSNGDVIISTYDWKFVSGVVETTRISNDYVYKASKIFNEL